MSNKLKNEQSPYLLQHAENPVNWYPWGDEAFKKAKEENKPIFLSIGYSTCHWCHVMAHESFEDPFVAKLINESFIPIKVDREERPDIDNIYMTVCQLMTGQGGWPLTIIMTPDKKPFFTGTYFPKQTRFGRIGVIDLIPNIKNLWDTQKNKVIDSAEQIILALKNITSKSPGNKLSEKTLKTTFNQIKKSYDPENGGFRKAPKFPTPHNFLFLLRYWSRTGEKKALEMVENTLKKMRNGGIYDQLSYGFHRYSTDSFWLVPHFEKMLYDQALLAMAYIETYQATNNKQYGQVAEEIFEYVLRDMTSNLGGFFSAEDADSEGEEGKFYVWKVEEIENILEEKDAKLIIDIFNLKKEGNYLEEATKQYTNHNIFHLKASLETISKDLGLNEEELKIRISKIRNQLIDYREKRIHPYKDDKILTDWNGLMIAALAKGYSVLKNNKYLEAAKKAVDFIMKTLRKSDGRLLHRYRNGSAEIDAYLDDYAFLIYGLIELYEACFDIKYLKWALELNNILIEHYWDDYIGGFFFTADDGEVLLTRQKEIYDGAIPSGNSVTLLNLLRLSYLTGDYTLEEKADKLNRVFAESISNNPIAYTMFMTAVDFVVGPSYSLVIAGKSNSKDTKDLLEQVQNRYIPNKILIQRPMEDDTPEIDNISNFVQYYEDLDGQATAYVCINKTCKPATSDINKIIEYLNPKWKEQ